MVILTLVLLTSLSPVASAGFSDIITLGLEGFVVSLSDEIFSMSFSGYDDSAGYGTVGYIYNIATYTPDPFQSEAVTEFIDFSKSIFQDGYHIILIFAFIFALILHFKPSALQQLGALTGMDVGSRTNIFFRTAINGIVILIAMYTCIYLVLEINDFLTKSVMISIVDEIAPTLDNYVLYFFMAIAYLFMGFFFSIRTLVIFLFVGFGFLIALALLISFTHDAAMGLCAYFTQTVFFQFIIVLYFSACVVIIQEVTTPIYPDSEETMYTIMIFGGVLLGIKMMFGTKVIKWAGRGAARLV